MIKLGSRDANGTHAVTYVNQQEVTFDEGEVRQLYCYVNGSYPKPDVKVSTGRGMRQRSRHVQSLREGLLSSCVNMSVRARLARLKLAYLHNKRKREGGKKRG